LTEIISKEWERAVLLAHCRVSEGNAWRVNRMNQVFLCRHHHSEGEGLIEVFTRHANAAGISAFQFSCGGEVLGILRIRPNGPEEIEFDRDQGIGDRDQAAERAIAVLRGLDLAT
jgi:hypothetical protein